MEKFMPTVPVVDEREQFAKKIVSGLDSTTDGANKKIEIRAAERDDEIRDLHVLEAFAMLEQGLRELLHSPDTGVLSTRDRDAQGCTRRVSEFFDTEGGKILNDLPDEESMARFTDVMSSRRRIAMITAAKHESREFASWKDKTVMKTVEEVIASAAADPDTELLEYGTGVIEGTIRRLYRGESEDVLQSRYIAAVKEMYRGALESVSDSEPLRAVELLDKWKNIFGEELYEELNDSITPAALREKVRDEYADLRFMQPDKAQKIIDTLKDSDLHAELSAMVGTAITFEHAKAKQEENSKLELIYAELFQKLSQSQLTPDQILYSKLSKNERLLWLKILKRSLGEADNSVFVKQIELLSTDNINSSVEIYSACSEGLSARNAKICCWLFSIRDRADWMPVALSLQTLQRECLSHNCDTKATGEIYRDFLFRLKQLIKAGKTPDFILLVHKVLEEHLVLSAEDTSGI
jgi:hypothetical protein